VDTSTRIIRFFQIYKPRTKEEIKKLGIKLTLLNFGAFREVFTVKGTNLVVKIPRVTTLGSPQSNIDHAKQEIDAYRRVFKRKSLKALRPFMPKFHYMDYRSGIVVVEKYKSARYSKISNIAINIISKVIEEVTEKDATEEVDLFIPNIGTDMHGNYKFIDLGLL
jgi:hypothetical protein